MGRGVASNGAAIVLEDITLRSLRKLRHLQQPQLADRPQLSTPHHDRLFTAKHDRLAEIRNNLTARIVEAERKGWLGEVEGLQISLAGTEDKLAQIRRRTRSQNTVELGIPPSSSR